MFLVFFWTETKGRSIGINSFKDKVRYFILFKTSGDEKIVLDVKIFETVVFLSVFTIFCFFWKENQLGLQFFYVVYQIFIYFFNTKDIS